MTGPAPRFGAVLALLLASFGCSKHGKKPMVPAGKKVDFHMHFPAEALPRVIELMDAHEIWAVVNLSGGIPGRGLEEQLQAAGKYPGRVHIFAELDWYLPSTVEHFGARLAQSLQRAHELGAAGLSIPRGLGLGFRTVKQKLLAIDDPELDPIFEQAAKLHLPVAIHTGAPVAYWFAPIASNERYDELIVSPELSLFEQGVPSWQELMLQLERRIARHPKCTFISVQFGNAAEYPDQVARFMTKYPNVWIDTAGRIPEIGRRSPSKLAELFSNFSDRILWGSDITFDGKGGGFVLSSKLDHPPSAAETEHFFRSSWRFFETTDKDFDHPSPIQGRWKVSGIGLSTSVLSKIYSDNAARLLTR